MIVKLEIFIVLAVVALIIGYSCQQAALRDQNDALCRMAISQMDSLRSVNVSTTSAPYIQADTNARKYCK